MRYECHQSHFTPACVMVRAKRNRRNFVVLPPENTKPIGPNPVLLITHGLPGSGDAILPQEVGTLTAGLEPCE